MRDALALVTPVRIRGPEVNALQDPDIDDLFFGLREAMVLTRIRQQPGDGTRERELEVVAMGRTGAPCPGKEPEICWRPRCDRDTAAC